MSELPISNGNANSTFTLSQFTASERFLQIPIDGFRRIESADSAAVIRAKEGWMRPGESGEQNLVHSRLDRIIAMSPLGAACARSGSLGLVSRASRRRVRGNRRAQAA